MPDAGCVCAGGYFACIRGLLLYIQGGRMDWELEQLDRREKIKATKKSGGDKGIDMMVAMEREFVQIFGAGKEGAFSGKRAKAVDDAGDYAGRPAYSQNRK